MWVPQSTQPYSSVEPEQSVRLTGGELADDEISSDAVDTDVLSIATCLDWRGRTAKGLTGASSTVAMAA